MEAISLVIGGGMLIALMIVAVAALFTLPVWLLWGWLAPIFGLPSLTFLQSWGLLVLCGLLFRSSSSVSSSAKT